VMRKKKGGVGRSVTRAGCGRSRSRAGSAWYQERGSSFRPPTARGLSPFHSDEMVTETTVRWVKSARAGEGNWLHCRMEPVLFSSRNDNRGRPLVHQFQDWLFCH